MHDIGEIRSLLQRSPSRAVWEALCAILDDATIRAQAEVLVPYCDGAMRHWPHTLRRAPRRWGDLALDGHAPPALSLARIARIDATGAPREALRAALDAPTFTHLLDLEIVFGDLDLMGARAVSRSDLAGRLQRLSISAIHRVQPRALSALVNAPGLAREPASLSLELRDSPNLDILLDAHGARVIHSLRLVEDPTDATFDALCESPYLTNLRDLDLSLVHLDPIRANKLSRAEHLRGVRRLDLSLTDPGGHVAWSAGTLEPLLFSPLLDALEHLDIEGLDDDSARALADADVFEDLSSLTLTLRNQRSVDALATILRAESRTPLEALRVSGGALDGALEHICSPALASLDLSNTSFTPADLTALSSLPSLGRLYIFNPRDVASLGELANALPARVERLAIDGALANAPVDLHDLSQWRGAPHAHSLTLRHALSSLMHDARAEACSQLDLSRWNLLTSLDLGANLLEGDHVRAILERAPPLDTLSVRHNQITDPATLTHVLPRRLRTLHLSANPLDSDALARLLSSDALQSLHALSLSNARLDDELLANALSNTNLPRLHTLSARRCMFGPLSAEALERSGLLSTLQQLDVAAFRQDRRAAAAIAEQPSSRNLTQLILSITGPVDLATLGDLRAAGHLRPRILSAMSAAYEVDSGMFSS